MAAFSGKKQFNPETTMTGSNLNGNPRSVGKKYLPVRISTAHFENPLGSRNPGSSRKTMVLSSRKPIRNIHKLLISPKRTARKRLDNLYDCSKPRETINPPIIKTQVLSAKKLAPKTLFNSAKKPDAKSGLKSQSSKQSRLLPPGTITGSYIKERNSLAPITSIHKPTKNGPTLVPKNSQVKRPSDVAEESPQPLELSSNCSDENGKLPTPNITTSKSTEDSKGVDSNGLTNTHKDSSPLDSPQDKKEKLSYCCKCSQIIDGSNQAKNEAKSTDTSIKILLNSKEITEPDLTRNENKAGGGFQRPTVIVMQRETAPRLVVAESDEFTQIPIQDGSYSEILSLQPSTNSSAVDESLLFKHTENACTRSEINSDLNSEYRTSEFIFMLVEQREYLTESISQHEKNLTSMKLMLESVKAELDKQKTIESSIKLKKGHSNLNSEEASMESSLKTKRPQGSKLRKNRKSSNAESGTEEEEKDLAEEKSKDSKQKDETIENKENEPPQRRRSARLASKNGDLSLQIGENTPAMVTKKITQAKSKPCTPSMTTPLRSAKWGRKSERPLREYMVLKSAIKFLNTPDSRRYRIGSDEKVQIRDSLDKTDNVLLSDKLLKELHDLYATP